MTYNKIPAKKATFLLRANGLKLICTYMRELCSHMCMYFESLNTNVANKIYD